MAVDPQLRDLARRMENVERQARQRKLPTLAFSAIDDGAISAVDVDGNLTAIFGKQYDGTTAPAIVNGPVPPKPVLPYVESLAGALRIYWDGTFADEYAVAPMDFARVQVYATPLNDFVFANPLDQTIVVGEIGSATGGEISANLSPGVEYAVFFATWSLAGKVSPPSDIATAITGTAMQGEQGVPGPPGPDGESLYTWVKYANDATGAGMDDEPFGKTHIGLAYNKTSSLESTNAADYTWSLIKGADGQDGVDGAQGIPGEPGADGQTTYTWIKYGTSAAGAGLSDDPTGKAYIGIAYNKTTQVESTNAADYTWSLLQGPQGIQGPNGADGQSLYTWIKYGGSPTTGMSDDPSGKAYMGLALNKTTPVESTNYADYTWSLIRGPQGLQGNTGPAGADGASLYTWVKYAEDGIGTAMSDDPTGKNYIGLAYNKTTPTESTTPSDYTWSLFRGTPSDGLGPATSPQPDVLGGLGSFFLRWVPPVNDDPLRFEVHVSPTQGFTPTSETLYAETSATSMTVRDLPVIDIETGKAFPFLYDTTYYFRIIAKDQDDAAPAGPETGGTLVRINSDDIAARSIIGENIAASTLTGDLFTGNLVLGSTISTGALDDDGNIVGARVELGPGGIMVIDASGETIALFPLTTDDDAYVRANFELMSAEVRDNFTMHGTNNSIAKDGALYLSEGVTAPTVSLTPTYQYEGLQLDTTTAVGPHVSNPGYDLGTFALNPAQITSMTWDSEWSCWVVCQQKSGGMRLWRFTSTGAIYNNLATGRPWVDDYNDKTMCRIGPGRLSGGAPASQAMLMKSGGDYYIWGYTPSGVGEINRIPASWILWDDQAPALAFDVPANRYILVQNSGGGGGKLQFRRFYMNPGTGGAFPNVSHTSIVEGVAGSASFQPINNCVFGTQVTNGGAERYVMSHDNIANVQVWDTAGASTDVDGAYEWWVKPGPALGFAHDGTNFASVDSSGRITKYSNWTWPAASDKAWVGTSLYDSKTATDTPEGLLNPHTGQVAGQHETPVGGLTSFTMRRRAKMVVNVPSLAGANNDDPDKYRVYWARQDAEPTAAQLKLAGTVGSPTSRTDLVITADPTGAAPPGGIVNTVGAVNNFPLATPGKIMSTGQMADGEPTIELRGDGAGRVGPLEWDTEGARVNPDWVCDTQVITFTGSTPIVVTHGLGVIPSAVVAQQASHVGTNLNFLVLSSDSTATTFTIYCKDHTNAYVSGARTVAWVAYR